MDLTKTIRKCKQVGLIGVYEHNNKPSNFKTSKPTEKQEMFTPAEEMSKQEISGLAE